MMTALFITVVLFFFGVVLVGILKELSQIVKLLTMIASQNEGHVIHVSSAANLQPADVARALSADPRTQVWIMRDKLNG